MKKILLLPAIGFVLILLGAPLAIYIWIGQSVKGNISTVQQQYPGTAEEALISFLLDEDNSTMDRSHLAIWTLGQIKSEKALPILKDYYRDDPKGMTCKGKHDSMLCQYEIHKAMIKGNGSNLLINH